MKLPDSARASIESGPLAHLTTLNPNGSPQVTVVWVSLARTYLGPDVKFPPMDDPPPGFVTRIEIDRLSGVGPWTGRAT